MPLLPYMVDVYDNTGGKYRLTIIHQNWWFTSTSIFKLRLAIFQNTRIITHSNFTSIQCKQQEGMTHDEVSGKE